MTSCAQCGGVFADVVAVQTHGTRAHGADFDYRDEAPSRQECLF